MKKLRILSPFNIFLFFFFLTTLVMLHFQFQRKLYQEERLGEKEVSGIIKNIEIGKYNTKIIVGDTLIATEGTYQLGKKVTCVGEVTVPSSQSNFYLFDYQKYLASKKIYYTMKADCSIQESSISLLYSIKNAIINRIEKRKSSSYLKAFLLGDTKDIQESVRASYQKNGISHLFSVSGMHIGFFFMIFSFLFKKEKLRNFILLLFLMFYLFLTNFSPSVMRASLFFFFSRILKRMGFTTIQSYLLFVMLMLWYRPYYLYHTGFLYSFTISFFLILFSNYFSTEKSYLKKIFKISFFSLLASIPIGIETNFSVNLLSPIYNLIFVPIISNILFPMSFLVFLLSFLDFIYYSIFLLLENLSNFLSSIPSTIILCHLPLLGIFIYYLFFSFAMHKIVKKEYKYSIVIFLILFIHFHMPFINPNGIILMMDVGQGDSTLIIYPYQKLSILVDTGGAFYSTSIATNIIIPSLHAHGLSSLDYLILSHGDLDHLGEALTLLQNFKIKNVILNSGEDNEKELDILNYLEQNNIPYQKVSKDNLLLKQEQVLFLNSKNTNDENEDSLVSFFMINNHSLLFMGDSGEETEKKLLQEYNLPNMDILKVGHHGSKYSSSGEFLSAINPNICLISSGIGNRYGHPHEETLNRLKLCNTYITSIDGAIKITIGKSMRVNTVR